MRHLRQVFVMVVLVALALLPGPSHALAAATTSSHHALSTAHGHADRGHHAFGDAMHGPMARRFAAAAAPCDHHRPAPGHRPCKACSVACCAPATAAVSMRPIQLAMMHRVRPPRPAADRPRAGAMLRSALKPPTFSA